MAGGIILRITYGYEVQDGVDEFVELIERANGNFNRSTVPGVFLVDVFPILKYFPEWLPGMSFLSLAREWKKETIASAEVPYAFTKNQMVVKYCSTFPSLFLYRVWTGIGYCATLFHFDLS
jgi:hypothetical protein